MATYFSIKDGNLSLSNLNSAFGASVSSFETNNISVSSVMLSTNFSTSPTFIVDNNYTPSYVALHTSSRNTSSSGTLDLTITETANNYTIIDNSPNKFVLTRTGNPVNTVLTPYHPNGWSGYFTGNTYLNTPFTSSVSLSNTATLEFWFYYSGGNSGALFSYGTTAGANYINSQLVLNSNGTFNLNGDHGQTGKTSNSTIVAQIGWSHIAVVTNSGNFNIYYNGTNITSSFNATNRDTVISYMTSYTAPTLHIAAAKGYTHVIGTYYTGHISNFRIIKGQALYTTNFIPPSAPLSLTANEGAISATATPILSNVSLLTLQNNTLKDNSSNNFYIGSAGNPTINQINPFTPKSYNPFIHSGSVYYNGSSRINTTNTFAFDFSLSSTNFTIETWVYHVSGGTNRGIVASRTNGLQEGWVIYINLNNKLQFGRKHTGGTWADTAIYDPLIPTNTWTHIALVKDTTGYTGYVNGISGTKILNSNGIEYLPAKPLAIGALGSEGETPFLGYISNFRITKGQALYTTNFIPPSAPLSLTANGGAISATETPILSNVSLLLNYNNLNSYTTSQSYPISSFSTSNQWNLLKLSSTLSASNSEILNLNVKTSLPNQLSLNSTFSQITAFDDTRNNIVASNSNAFTLSSVTIGYTNTNAFFLSGAGNNWMTVPANPLFNFNGDFNIEFWINTSTWSADTNVRKVINFGTDVNNNLQIIFRDSANPSNILSIYSNANLIVGTSAVADGNWHHVALTRYGTALKLFVDGGQSGPTVTNTTIYNSGTASPMSIGSNNNTTTGRLSGCIANLRIIKDLAVYTQPFTVPSIQSVSATPETIFLLKDGVINNFNRMLVNEPTNIDAVSPVLFTDLYIGGVLSGSNTQNISITADSFSLSSLNINNGGTLTFPTSGSKTLIINGSRGLNVNSGGILNIGTSSVPILSSTTHVITLSNTNLIISQDATFNSYGSYKVPYSYLVVDSPATTGRFIASQSLSSNWLNGDNIIFTNNINGLSTFDSLTLSTFDSDTVFRTTGNSTYSHNSLSFNPFVPGISNITRNVKLSGIGSSNVFINGGNDNIFNTEFNNINFSINNDTIVPTNINNNVFNIRNFNISKPDWVGSFSGTTNNTGYLSLPLNYVHFAASDFTIEAWVYKVGLGSGMSVYSGQGDGATAAGSQVGFVINDLTGASPTTDIYIGATPYPVTSPKVPLNTWCHVAFVRIGGTASTYLNGTIVGTISTLGSLSANQGTTTYPPGIGGYALGSRFNGYMSNFRIIKGQGIYTTNFIPPTANLGLIHNGGATPSINPLSSNVSILTLQDYIIKDNSINNLIITNTGNVSIIYTGLPFGNSSNINLNSNILYRNNLSISNKINLRNLNFTNNLILSNINTGLTLQNLSCINVTMSGNYIAGLSGIGTYIQNCSGTNSIIGGTMNYNGTRGVVISGSNPITIGNIGGVSNIQEGIYVDASSYNLVNTTFSNITSNNNNNVGFRLSGNNLNFNTPTFLNINGLTANNNNNNNGIEAYNICGNINNVLLDKNFNISIGNNNIIFNNISSKSDLNILSSTNYNETIISNSTINNIRLSSARLETLIINNSNINSLSSLSSTNSMGGYLSLNNTVLSSGIQSLTSISNNITVMNGGQIFNNHYKITPEGKISYDSVVFMDVNGVSEKLEPYSNIYKLRSSPKYIPVNIGSSTIVSVYVKKSVGYTGDAPRLMLKRNASLGYKNTVLATSIASNDTWEKLTGNIPSAKDNGIFEVYIDCSGNAGSGSINIDNWDFN